MSQSRRKHLISPQSLGQEVVHCAFYAYITSQGNSDILAQNQGTEGHFPFMMNL